MERRILFHKVHSHRSLLAVAGRQEACLTKQVSRAGRLPGAAPWSWVSSGALTSTHLVNLCGPMGRTVHLIHQFSQEVKLNSCSPSTHRASCDKPAVGWCRVDGNNAPVLEELLSVGRGRRVGRRSRVWRREQYSGQKALQTAGGAQNQQEVGLPGSSGAVPCSRPKAPQLLPPLTEAEGRRGTHRGAGKVCCPLDCSWETFLPSAKRGEETSSAPQSWDIMSEDVILGAGATVLLP